MSSYLHSQIEALKTQCWEQTKTQNESTLEKDTVFWRNSSQCNIPQCKYPSFILCRTYTYIFFFEGGDVNESTNSRKKITTYFFFFFYICIDWDNHALVTPTHKHVHVFCGKIIKCAVAWHRLTIKWIQINVTISGIVSTLRAFSHQDIFGRADVKLPLAVPAEGGTMHGS